MKFNWNVLKKIGSFHSNAIVACQQFGECYIHAFHNESVWDTCHLSLFSWRISSSYRIHVLMSIFVKWWINRKETWSSYVLQRNACLKSQIPSKIHHICQLTRRSPVDMNCQSKNGSSRSSEGTTFYLHRTMNNAALTKAHDIFLLVEYSGSRPVSYCSLSNTFVIFCGWSGRSMIWNRPIIVVFRLIWIGLLF